MSFLKRPMRSNRLENATQHDRSWIRTALINNAPLALEHRRKQGDPGTQITISGERWWVPLSWSIRVKHVKRMGWALYTNTRIYEAVQYGDVVQLEGTESIYLLATGQFATNLGLNRDVPQIGVRVFNPRKIDTESMSHHVWLAFSEAQLALRRLAGIDG